MSRLRPWSPEAQRARAQRRALAELVEQQQAEQSAGAWQLTCAILEQTIVDLRTADGGVLEDAVRYLLEGDGELVRWHADVLGIDVEALRRRAQALLGERFGAEAGADLWERLARVAGGMGRRVA